MNFQGEDIGFITPEQEAKLLQLKELYEFWNQQINVISRKDMDNFYVHHVLHSLAIANVFSFRPRTELIDLGCGGGFPGIPLAICFPKTHFHMVDSINKKLKVVIAVASELGLDNITAEHTRAEDIKNRKFDGVISRAVAPLKDLWRWSRPLLKKDGAGYGLICLKGGDLAQEIHDSGKRVHQWEIFGKMYKNEWFKEKYILQIKK
ncbi:MAG: 16S rRNA (guanine(527)-N(7))-methyltransferase RsmG [Chitinophagaceae bacterium]|nr:16S rRNA (guanine(527)-N(7))-methyltransferase RsmG [Chitinophagaceae bacterium]